MTLRPMQDDVRAWLGGALGAFIGPHLGLLMAVVFMSEFNAFAKSMTIGGIIGGAILAYHLRDRR